MASQFRVMTSLSDCFDVAVFLLLSLMRKFYVSYIPGSGIMESLYVRNLAGNLEIEKKSVWIIIKIRVSKQSQIRCFMSSESLTVNVFVFPRKS